jgi:hypothetical protein
MGSTTVANLVAVLLQACPRPSRLSAACSTSWRLSTRWRLELTWRTFFSTSVTALALSTLTSGCKQTLLRLHYLFGALSTPTTSARTYMELPYIIIFAVLMGLVGALCGCGAEIVSPSCASMEQNYDFLFLGAATCLHCKFRISSPY